MKEISLNNVQDRLLDNLMELPNKIIQNHDLEHLPQIVLHYLGHTSCFGLEKAAFFADNPEFDHLLGAAGFHKNECCFGAIDDLWKDPNAYCEHMQKAAFHIKIREILKSSLKRKDIDLGDSDDLKHLAEILDIKNPRFLSWNLKHGNHGVLIYNGLVDDSSNRLLKKAVSFLGFCSISF